MRFDFEQPRSLLTLSGNGRIVSPNDFFAAKYSAETKAFGPAMLEQHTLGLDGVLQITPVSINEDFFAGVIGGSYRDSKVIFYAPEHLFYYNDPVLGHFTPTTEEKLHLCLSQEFIQCATYFSQHSKNVDVGPLFQELRSPEALQAIVERSKALLARDESFFAEASGNRKDPIRLSGEQTARLFVAEAIARQDGAVLKLGDAYDKYWYFCDQKGLHATERRKFKEPSATAIKTKFRKGLRSDLKLDGKWIDGWKDLKVSEVLVTG